MSRDNRKKELTDLLNEVDALKEQLDAVRPPLQAEKSFRPLIPNTPMKATGSKAIP
ncbi:MAG: hypothetical protein Q3M24_06070 [Candidatus Electrothrix aestuarii]|uniref:Uncharacterized protein n=1 Tax=Candidatus Electrothrix aestuarii TaxID=3062594 RepID=A0AAU8LZI5_9BACT|nr:hypothetical protein [Candidatus Electrothrix aestuarii]